MAGLSIPDDFPLNAFVGQELSHLMIGRHHLTMNFIRIRTIVANVPKYEDGARLDIEAGFHFQTVSGESILANNSDIATGAGSLTELLGKTILEVQRLPNNELKIKFSNDSEIVLIVDPQGFESYSLSVDGIWVEAVTKEW
jgi:hypothetical protein